MSIDIREQFLTHIKVSHAALDAANEELTKQAADKKASAEKIPSVVQAMLKHSCIFPNQADSLAQALEGTPVRVLEILMKTADVTERVNLKPLGIPQPGEQGQVTKQANILNPRAPGFRGSAAP